PLSSLISSLSLHDALPICLADSLVSRCFGSIHLFCSRYVNNDLRDLWNRSRGSIENQSRVARQGEFAIHLARRSPSAAGCGHLRSEEHTSELQSRENLVCR